MNTIVLQSHRNPLPHAWLDICMHSVRAWAQANGFDYRFVGDELFDSLDGEVREKTRSRLPVAADLARLILLKSVLEEGYTTAVWLDADFLIFNPAGFLLIDSSYALGREVWVQEQGAKLRAYVKVHNAFLLFRQPNPFLEFYLYSAEKLINAHVGAMSPQFVGPKFLTAIHNLVSAPVQESAAMLSPLVIKNLNDGGGAALDLFLARSKTVPCGVNLCASLVSNQLSRQRSQPGAPPSDRHSESLSNQQVEACIAVLMERGFNPAG